MKKLVLTIIAVLAVSFAAGAANYTMDESAIDAMIESCEEIAPVSFQAAVPSSPAPAAFSDGTKKAVTSFILCTFLGGFGVHRHYMGTSKGMWAAYTFTFGGIFGIVPFVDWVMLIIGMVDDDISEYIGNTKFFMWA